jgi:hypothetical protein
VLVAPDHRVFNASTLRYEAEAGRRPLSFVHLASARALDERLWEFDAGLVKEGGSQGPPHELHALSAVEHALRRHALDWEASDTYECPDGSRIRVVAMPDPLDRQP